MLQAQIITIGDEILIGQIVDTNSAWLSSQFNAAGILVNNILSIADTREAIHAALDDISSDIQVVVMTGGLGPTKDDITKGALAEWFSSGWKTDEGVLEQVKGLFAERGIEMPTVNADQARLPEKADVLHNAYGTAPGMWFEKNDTIFISMPGVPFEMKYIFEFQALPKLQERFAQTEILHKTIMTQGIGESSIMDIIVDWEADLEKDKVKLAYLPAPGMVRLRLSLMDGAGIDGKALLNHKVNQVLPLLQDYAFAFDDEKLEMNLGRMLHRGGYTISTAESCTGGYISHLITSIAGSSRYYNGSAITYTNESKTNVLGVSAAAIAEHGAVSEQVALQMAEGVKKLYKSDFAIATTGIAGPDGGSEEKPVGTVWIAIATPEKIFAQKFLLGKHRERTIRRFALQAMQLARKEIIASMKISQIDAMFLEE